MGLIDIFRKNKRMKFCYLHIGSPKTGTSAIQNILYCNKDKLLSEGYVYPDYGVRFDKNGVSDGNSKLLLRAIMNHDFSEADQINQRLKSALKNYNVILSGEDLFNRAYINGFEIINRIFSDINVKVVVFVRNQAEIIQSAIKQRIKNHGKFDYEIPGEYYTRFDWALCLRLWASEFGSSNVLVDVYEGRGVAENIEDKFLRLVGLSNLVGKCSAANLVNESLSGFLLESLRNLNSLSLPRDRHEKLKSALIEYDKISSHDSKGWSLSGAQIREIEEKFKSSNNELRERFSIAIPAANLSETGSEVGFQEKYARWLLELLAESVPE